MSDPDSSDKPRRSGYVRHDAGGRAIWEWALDSSRQAIDSTSRLLKRLELTGMTLMGDDAKPWERDGARASQARRSPETHTDPDPAPRAPPPAPEPEDGNKGVNPYDTRTPVGRGAPAAKKPATPHPRVTPPPRKRGFFARLFGRR